MNNSLEGTFGTQEEFPIGNRDRDIDDVLKDIGGEVPETEEGIKSLAMDVLDEIAKKYNIDLPDFVVPQFTIATPGENPDLARGRVFSSVYNLDYIKSRIEGRLK